MKFEMPNSAAWMETLKQFKEFEEDKEVAAFLDVPKQSVSQWKSGKHQFDTATCWKLGIALGVNPLFIIACASYHKEANPEKRKKWVTLASPIEPKTVEAAEKKRKKLGSAYL